MIRYKEAPANDLNCTSLLPEQQLSLLREQAAPLEAHVAQWQWLLWLAPLGLILLLTGQPLVGSLALLGAFSGFLGTLTERRLLGGIRRQVSLLSAQVRSVDAVAPLLDFARWQGREAPECHTALERLLPRLDTERGHGLSVEQRAYLRRCVEGQDPSVEFTMGALLVLGSLADTATIPIARKLAVSSSSQRIRDAAELCLEELGGSEKND
jgi:hypothetical protein